MDMRFFDYMHLPKDLRTVSRVMHGTAWMIQSLVTDGPEKEAGMRKLLEAKDCFVRASLPAKQPVPCTRNYDGPHCECGQCTHNRNARKDAK